MKEDCEEKRGDEEEVLDTVKARTGRHFLGEVFALTVSFVYSSFVQDSC